MDIHNSQDLRAYIMHQAMYGTNDVWAYVDGVPTFIFTHDAIVRLNGGF